MTKDEICKNLCCKDERHPDYYDLYGYFLEWDDPEPIPRINCYCDNCFYGRDILAVEILRLMEEIEP